MQFIDSHCHLDFSEFDSDRHQVVSDAYNAGVRTIIVPGVQASTWEAMLLHIHAAQEQSDINSQPVSLIPAFGLHPYFIEHHKPEHIQWLDKWLSTASVCAVGEIGLDKMIPNSCFDQQLRLFEQQLDLAKTHHLPVILHVRKAHDQVLKLLRQKQLPKGGVVHAFSGSEQQAEQYLALGFKLGLGGVITYERAKKQRRIATQFPLTSFVLETDAPDMPLSGQPEPRNTPANVSQVAKVLAQLREEPIEDIARVTSATSSSLFGFKEYCRVS